jgi:regulator of protease activity HflC (stomatin/prohibitin superfamily)
LLATALVEGVALLSYLSYFFLDLPEQTDLWLARFFVVILVGVGLEVFVGIFFSFYRIEHVEDEPPAYESRFLSVLFQPGSITKNVAELVQYQFGVEVSERWFLSFVERVLFPLLVVIAVVMWLMTSIVLVPFNSQGIRERFGVVVSRQPLESGVYFKLPYPFARIRTFPVGEVQEFTLGHKNEPGFVPPEVLLWTKAHVSHETRFLLPEGQSGNGGNSEAISMLSAEVPVHFLVTDLYKYLYHFSDAKLVLENASRSVLVRYFAQTDFFNFLGFDRFKGAGVLVKSIQEQADLLDLGVKIVAVNFGSVHPPVAVGSVFQQVSSAKEERATMIESAYAHKAELLPRVRGEAYQLVKLAESYRDSKIKVAQAERKRFLEQVKAYEVAPEYVALVEEMGVIERSAGRRKYILSKQIKKSVFRLNLEDKLTPDLLDMNLDEPKK